ncbi:MAG: transcriptional regulator [Nocardia sp.]|uniref:helix-turn-helix domain-containing protein n=1 Tax=Nocardia sp. TaxID=1821 RepID=UPI0026237487|nr:helix-turn-helix transcriptional regulator [Nocardia sp.]MCU1643972.1 transcriptional regulator [Nocardia sp.]
MIEDLTSVGSNRTAEEPGEDPALLRRVLGVRLRRLRESAGISGDGAGRAIRASHSKISRLEAGRVSFRARDIADLLTAYGVRDAGTRAEYLLLAQRANAVGRWQAGPDLATARPDTYLAMEDASSLIRCYAPGLVPELLWTPSYAHTVFAIADREPAADIQRRVESLVRRQRLLTRTDPPRAWFVVEEAALRRPIGGNAVWQGQLDHLAELAARPNITVQVLPDHVGGPAISGTAFTMLRFAASELNDLAHFPHPTGPQFLDKRTDLDRFNAIWDRLCVCATPPERTAAALETLTSTRCAAGVNR